MASTHPEPYIRLPTASHQTTLILLHGTSQTGPRFAESFLATEFSPARASLATSSTAPAAGKQVTFPGYFPGCRFVFPTGAPRRTTVFGGRETNAWFDITDFGDRTKGEAGMIAGMRESSFYLADLVRAESELLDGKGDEYGQGDGKVCLAGFSQGSAMGFMLLLSGELHRRGSLHGFGGFIGLSGWLPFRVQIEGVISRQDDGVEDPPGDETATNRGSTTAYVRRLLGLETIDEQWSPGPDHLDVPIFVGHGESDVKVKFGWGLQLKDTLRDLGMDVAFHPYASLQHWWAEQEMDDVAEFLDTRWHGIQAGVAVSTYGSRRMTCPNPLVATQSSAARNRVATEYQEALTWRGQQQGTSDAKFPKVSIIHRRVHDCSDDPRIPVEDWGLVDTPSSFQSSSRPSSSEPSRRSEPEPGGTLPGLCNGPAWSPWTDKVVCACSAGTKASRTRGLLRGGLGES